MTILNILMQNESASFADIVGTVTLTAAADSAEAEEAPAAPTAQTVTLDDLVF